MPRSGYGFRDKAKRTLTSIADELKQPAGDGEHGFRRVPQEVLIS